MRVHQINLQQHFGGGEVYTAFLCRALDQLGVSTHLLVHSQATFWNRLDLPASTRIIPAGNGTQIAQLLDPEIPWSLGHGALPRTLVEHIHAQSGLATAIAHMPVQDRNPAGFSGHDMVFPVSGWVRDGLIAADLPTWPEPLYGVADLTQQGEKRKQIHRTSCYDWDIRKFRDRLLSWIEPAVEPLRPHPVYRRNPGLTLGIVSRLTPIKQFPLLFAQLAPVLTCFPNVNLEIFGSGGYASVRDLSHALRPITDRVRFWGHQRDVVSVYQGIDYLLSGLPEKEALGLNIIEAQHCGTPVLAPFAPPFTETVVDGVTGFLYRDPRKDNGEDFGRLLERLHALPSPPDPRAASEHLARFSFGAFVARITPLLEWAANASQNTHPKQGASKNPTSPSRPGKIEPILS